MEKPLRGLKQNMSEKIAIVVFFIGLVLFVASLLIGRGLGD